MARVWVFSNDKCIQAAAPEGSSLLDALLEQGIAVQADCGGHGRCGNCTVRLHRLKGEEAAALEKKENPSLQACAAQWGDPGRDVLACTEKIAGDCAIQVPEAEAGGLILEDTEWLSAAGRMAAAPAAEAAASNRPSHNPDRAVPPPPARADTTDAKSTSAPAEGRGEAAASPLDAAGFAAGYGAALDLGTTTLVLQLLEPGSGRILASRSDWNAQRRYGSDVLSRVQYTMEHPGGRARLGGAVRRQVSRLLREACREAAIPRQAVTTLFVAGNTIMQHLFCEIPADSIVAAPYTPATYFTGAGEPTADAIFSRPSEAGRPQDQDAAPPTSGAGEPTADPVISRPSEAGRPQDQGAAPPTSGAGEPTADAVFSRPSEAGRPQGQGAAPPTSGAGPYRFSELPGVAVWMAPCVAGYVGGDITAGLWAVGAATRARRMLFLDIGTNGEMALGDRDGLTCCSTACGPAFEGAEITCGMASTPGAVSHVQWDGADLALEVVGDAPPKGVCGSGLIDLLACLLEKGIVDETGRLLPPEEAPEAYADRIGEDENGNGVFYVTGRPPRQDGGPSAQRPAGQAAPVVLTAEDVRKLQLAKAAVGAGIRVLLQETQSRPENIDEVLLAGGFGSHLRVASAAAIGMIPEELADRVHPVGNSSLAGARAALHTPQAQQEMDALREHCHYIELATHAAFSEEYIEQMIFA